MAHELDEVFGEGEEGVQGSSGSEAEVEWEEEEEEEEEEEDSEADAEDDEEEERYNAALSACDLVRQGRPKVDLDNWEALGDAGAQAVALVLADRKASRRLKELSMVHTGLGPPGAHWLALSLVDEKSKLKRLWLGDNEILCQGARAIARVLEKSNSLRILDLAMCGIGNNGARALMRALQSNTSLESLHLSVNNIGGDIPLDVAIAIAQALDKNHTLRKLDLANNAFSDADAPELANALRNQNGLVFLNLSDNPQLGRRGVLALVQALNTNRSLQTLEMNRMHSEDADGIIDLEILGAFQTALGSPGCMLRSLSLVGNRLGDHHAPALAAILTTPLQRLDLRENLLGVEGARTLSTALRANHTLTALNLLNNAIDADSAMAIFAEVVEVNHTLQELGLDGNTGIVLADRLRGNALKAGVGAWAVAAVARRINQLPDMMNAQVAVLASGTELVPTKGWRSAAGHRLESARILLAATHAYIDELTRLRGL
jgi:Ran GTPase-activating protein (RanGAP) involved in mRNA processing and transport